MERSHYLEEIENHFQVHSVCALLGPRQVGKTTLAKMYIKQHPEENVLVLDLENPLDLARLENPMLALSNLDILAGTFMIRILTPWFENLGKRQIKSLKIYFRDSSLLHVLLGIHEQSELDTYPKLGSFRESFAMEEIIRRMQPAPEECYFWVPSQVRN